MVDLGEIMNKEEYKILVEQVLKEDCNENTRICLTKKQWKKVKECPQCREILKTMGMRFKNGIQ